MRHPILFGFYLLLTLTVTITAAALVALLPIHGATSGLLVTSTVIITMLSAGIIGDKLHLAD